MVNPALCLLNAVPWYGAGYNEVWQENEYTRVTQILIAEDANFSRAVLRRMLQEEGYDILEVGNGKQCLDILATESPDCLILDLLMPEVTGYEVLARLAQQGKTIPVLVVTADVQETTRQQCLALGAIAVLNKPPKPEQIHEILQQVLPKA
ncbi:response regulator [Spirulina sp. CS-785/01]|uniref:response regulator n=1 Tax=Spirulina sp. CS-785/01 TaxID=3021716 RepID=UPI00232B1083|nr:response regulator [Spirulina sp. CS-785/01]MDB9311994.1 response regulator [Spirulina sp. CS-785/01]